MPGHDRHRDRIAPAVLPRLATSGPGPSLPVPAASTRIAMSSSSSISLRICSEVSPSRITRSGVMPATPLARARELVELLVGGLVRLGLHDVGDAEPLLMAVVRLDHEQHHDARAGARGAAARVIDRAVALRRFIDDDEELRLVPRLVAAALKAHRRSPGFRRLGRRADHAGMTSRPATRRALARNNSTRHYSSETHDLVQNR